jgi:hypothetical protein
VQGALRHFDRRDHGFQCSWLSSYGFSSAIATLASSQHDGADGGTIREYSISRNHSHDGSAKVILEILSSLSTTPFLGIVTDDTDSSVHIGFVNYQRGRGEPSNSPSYICGHLEFPPRFHLSTCRRMYNVQSSLLEMRRRSQFHTTCWYR